jgi:hypothetical protein|tara:strand:- start:436 stop:708 length:273 start_codon:yes stop_codon:yes gene_type:complete
MNAMRAKKKPPPNEARHMAAATSSIFREPRGRPPVSSVSSRFDAAGFFLGFVAMVKPCLYAVHILGFQHEKYKVKICLILAFVHELVNIS